MMSRSGVTAFDNDVRDAEVARQAAMVAGVSQSAANSASITFYKSVITRAVNTRSTLARSFTPYETLDRPSSRLE
jgi:hypothetical protein